MSKYLKIFTEMHLKTSKLMPRKNPPLYLGEEKYKKEKTRRKKERNKIAKYYWMLRSVPDQGDSKTAHRYGVVVTAGEANCRIRYLENNLP